MEGGLVVFVTVAVQLVVPGGKNDAFRAAIACRGRWWVAACRREVLRAGGGGLLSGNFCYSSNGACYCLHGVVG